MDRTTVWIWTALLVGCKGGAGDGTADFTVPVVLSSTSGEVDVDGGVVDDTCRGDAEDAFRNLTIKFDQVATGLSVFIDSDVGWIPCFGSIHAFDCEWGNAPGSTPDGTWSWSLIGTTNGSEITATLTLTVTCQGGGNNCDACEVVGEYSGTL